MDVCFEWNRAGPSILGRRTGRITSTGTFGHTGAYVFCILPLEIITMRFHLEAFGANGNTVRTQNNAMVILSFLCVTLIEINERLNVQALAELVHSH